MQRKRNVTAAPRGKADANRVMYCIMDEGEEQQNQHSVFHIILQVMTLHRT